MNTIIQSQLDRVETALTILIDSVAAYNPSIPAANSLLIADDKLHEGLKHLAKHQSNHARILTLQEKISQQNANITSTLTTLADTHKDLVSIPTSLPSKDTRKVPYDELLDYAKRISRYTVPPTAVLPIPPASAPQPQPVPSHPVNGDVEVTRESDKDAKGMGIEALDDEEKKWLEPLKQLPFVPWISDDVMKRGALAQIQAMVERAEDPADAKPENAEQVSNELIHSGDGMEGVHIESGIGSNNDEMKEAERRQQRAAQKPQVFGGLDLYDPSNPDEND